MNNHMANYEAMIGKKIKQENEQNTMRAPSFDHPDYLYENLDFKMAYIISDFLTEKSDKLPKYEFVDKTIKFFINEGARNTKISGVTTIYLGTYCVHRFVLRTLPFYITLHRTTKALQPSLT